MIKLSTKLKEEFFALLPLTAMIFMAVGSEEPPENP
jgi:hypothetical protein